MKKAATTTMTVELPVQLKGRLEEIAKTAEMSSAELALDAISSYVESLATSWAAAAKS